MLNQPKAQKTLVMLLLTLMMNMRSVAAVVSGSMAAQTTTISARTRYNFYLEDWQAAAGASTKLQPKSSIVVTFPKETYAAFLGQSRTLAQQDCAPDYGFGAGETLSCKIDATAGTLTVELAVESDLRSIGFFVNGVINADEAAQQQFTITLLAPGGTQLDSSSSGTFSVTMTPDQLRSAVLVSTNKTVSGVGDLKVQMVMKSAVRGPTNLLIKFPAWSSNVKYIDGTTCQFTSNDLAAGTAACTIVQDVSGSLVTISGALPTGVTAGQSITFTLKQVRNPPSLRGISNIVVSSQAATSKAIVDTLTTVQLIPTEAATVPRSYYSVTFNQPFVAQTTEMSILIRFQNPVPSGSRIAVTVPPQISVRNYLTRVFTKGRNAQGNIAFSYGSTDQEILISSAITHDYEAGNLLYLYFENVRTPVSTSPTDDFTVVISEVYQQRTYDIERSAAGFKTQVQFQTLTRYEFTSSNTSVMAPFEATISVSFRGVIQRGWQLEIALNSQLAFVSAAPTPTCRVSMVRIGDLAVPSTVPCTLDVATRKLTLPNAAARDYDFSSAGGTIQVSIANLFLNPLSEKPVDSSFGVFLKDAQGNVVGKHNAESGLHTYAAKAIKITNFAASCSGQVTGEQTTVRLTATFVVKQTLPAIQLLITPPSQVGINASAPLTCKDLVQNTAIPCTIEQQADGTQAIKVSEAPGGSSKGDSQGQYKLDIEIGTLRAPYSTKTTDSFVIKVMTADGYLMAVQDTLAAFSVSKGSPFSAVVVKPGSDQNGVQTTYDFAITLTNPLDRASTFKLRPPAGITVSPFSGSQVQCRGARELDQKIQCLLIQGQVFVTLYFDQVQQLPSGYVAEFSLGPVRNPPSLKQSDSFSIQAVTASDFLVSEQTTGITVQNKRAATIVSAEVSATVSTLGANSSYQITFTPKNQLPQGGEIQVTMPKLLKRVSNNELNCTTSLNGGDRWTCTYDEKTHLVKIKPTTVPVASSVPQPIVFFINGFQNPMQAQFDESFQIHTYDQFGFAMDEITSGLAIAQDCEYPCATCGLSRTTCLSCKAGDFAFLFNNTCRASCPSGYFDDGTFICKKCDPICSLCKGRANFCVKCSNPFHRLHGESGTCTDQCPDGQYADSGTGTCLNCVAPCKTCSSKTQCTSCSPGQVRYNGTCLDGCPRTMIATPSGQECEACDKPCLECGGTKDKCTSCDSTGSRPFLYGAKCLEKCPTGYFALLPDSQTCQLIQEDVVPFVFLMVAFAAVLIIGALKLCSVKMHFKNTLLAVLSVICLAEWIYLLYLTIRDSHWQSSVIIIFGLGCNYLLNIVFGWLYCFVIRKDAYYGRWRRQRACCESFLVFLAMLTTFQLFRLIFQELSQSIKIKKEEDEKTPQQKDEEAVAGKKEDDETASDYQSEDETTVKQIFNSLSIIMICSVALPVLVQNIYNLFFTHAGRQLFWEDIQSIALTSFLIILMIYDACKKTQKINLSKLRKPGERVKQIQMEENDQKRIEADKLASMFRSAQDIIKFRDVMAAVLKQGKDGHGRRLSRTDSDDEQRRGSTGMADRSRPGSGVADSNDAEAQGRLRRRRLDDATNNNLDVTGNGRMADTTVVSMHTEDAFGGPNTTERGLLKAGGTDRDLMMRENEAIFSGRDIRGSDNVFARATHGSQGDGLGGQVRMSSPARGHIRVIRDTMNSEANLDSEIKQDPVDRNRQNIHGATDSEILRNLGLEGDENLRDSHNGVVQAHDTRSKSLIKNRLQQEGDSSIMLDAQIEALQNQQQQRPTAQVAGNVGGPSSSSIPDASVSYMARAPAGAANISTLKSVDSHFSVNSGSGSHPVGGPDAARLGDKDASMQREGGQTTPSGHMSQARVEVLVDDQEIKVGGRRLDSSGGSSKLTFKPTSAIAKAALIAESFQAGIETRVPVIKERKNKCSVDSRNSRVMHQSSGTGGMSGQLNGDAISANTSQLTVDQRNHPIKQIDQIEYHVKELEARASDAEARGSEGKNDESPDPTRTRALRRGTIADSNFNVQDIRIINADLKRFSKRDSIESGDSVRQRRLDELSKAANSRNREHDTGELGIQRRYTQPPESSAKQLGEDGTAEKNDRASSAVQRPVDGTGELTKKPVAGLKDAQWAALFKADEEGKTPRRGSDERPSASNSSRKRTRKIGLKRGSAESSANKHSVQEQSSKRAGPTLKELYNIEETADRKVRRSSTQKTKDAIPTPEARTISPRRRLVHLSKMQQTNINQQQNPSTLSPMEIAGAYGDRLITQLGLQTQVKEAQAQRKSEAKPTRRRDRMTFGPDEPELAQDNKLAVGMGLMSGQKAKDSPSNKFKSKSQGQRENGHGKAGLVTTEQKPSRLSSQRTNFEGGDGVLMAGMPKITLNGEQLDLPIHESDPRRLRRFLMMSDQKKVQALTPRDHTDDGSLSREKSNDAGNSPFNLKQIEAPAGVHQEINTATYEKVSLAPPSRKSNDVKASPRKNASRDDTKTNCALIEVNMERGKSSQSSRLPPGTKAENSRLMTASFNGAEKRAAAVGDALLESHFERHDSPMATSHLSQQNLDFGQSVGEAPRVKSSQQSTRPRMHMNGLQDGGDGMTPRSHLNMPMSYSRPQSSTANLPPSSAASVSRGHIVMKNQNMSSHRIGEGRNLSRDGGSAMSDRKSRDEERRINKERTVRIGRAIVEGDSMKHMTLATSQRGSVNNMQQNSSFKRDDE